MRRRERGGVRSVVGPGLVAVSLGVVAVAALLAPGEPVQYAMAQTKPAAKPILDTSGIKIIQELPVGESEYYSQQEELNRLIEKHGKEKLISLGWNLIPMELILNSVKNLAIMQMGLAEFVKFDPDTGAVILEGDFGRVLQEILGFDPEEEWGVSVEHTDFIQTDLGKKDCYRLTINCRNIDLILRDFAGYDGWGIRGLVLSQDSEIRDARGMPYTEYKELAIHQVEDGQNPGKYKFVALYTVITLAPDGTIVAREEWEFAQGNPKAVSYRRH